MDSDPENVSSDTDDERSTTGSDSPSSAIDESIWHIIKKNSHSDNIENWLKLLNED